MTLQEKIAALPPMPTLEQAFENGRAWEISRREDWYAKRLALAREWILTSVPHLEGCPWRGLTRDAQGLLPGCSCGRDALLAAMEVPK